MKPNSCACYGSNDIHECYCNNQNNMKQETLEEVAERLYPINSSNGAMEMIDRHQLNNSYKQEGFKECAKWQQERMYSEEDMQEYAEFCVQCFIKNLPCIIAKDWFTQFKK